SLSHLVLGSWSPKQRRPLKAGTRILRMNVGTLEEQPVLLTAESSLESLGVEACKDSNLWFDLRPKLLPGKFENELSDIISCTLLSLRLDCQSSAWYLAVDLCICFH
ncbi:hypothetical protein STEG23_000760, partial [Scotinomys teguina]